jgi:DNA polymerase III subunit chi
MEILFYHLQSVGVEKVLPDLLEKTLARGWKAVVRVSSDERLKMLDDHLWTYRDDAFLPHAVEADQQVAEQPIVLSKSDRRHNDAEVMFAVDSAPLPDGGGWTRAVLMFDGNDEEAVASARVAWKAVKAAGREATYWKQDDSGRWQKAG